MSVHIPAAIELRVVAVADIGPALRCLADRVLSYLESPDMTYKDYLDAKLKEVTDKISAEHDEVMAAVNAGGNATGEIPDDVKAQLDQTFSAIADAVGGVFTPAVAPTPEPAPEPTPAPTPEPAPVPGAEGNPVPSSVSP